VLRTPSATLALARLGANERWQASKLLDNHLSDLLSKALQVLRPDLDRVRTDLAPAGMLHEAEA
jgi:hypothetical protein